MLTFRAHNGEVLFRDGAHREVTLTEDQTAILLDIFQASEARETFLELYEASRDAGHIPRTHCLRLVSDNTAQGVVREMLAASCAEIEAAMAAQAMEQSL
jgi:hypothetical protein